MKINDVLKFFVKESSEKLNLMSIIQFGSSTYSKDPQDIDLIFFSNDDVFSSGDYVKLFKLIKKFENNYEDVVFDIGAGIRIRQGKYKISIVPLQNFSLELESDPFFANNIFKDKDKKILFGKNPFRKEIKLNNKFIASRILLQINWSLRECLDNETRNEAINFMFKSVLRYMLSNEKVSKKGHLIKTFIKIYPKIKLPKDSKEILSKKISKGDLKDTIDFANECVNFLRK